MSRFDSEEKNSLFALMDKVTFIQTLVVGLAMNI